ncbi:MAG: nitroreductase family protein [Alphaproteobacteria bacterium]
MQAARRQIARPRSRPGKVCMKKPRRVPLTGYTGLPAAEAIERARAFRERMATRRTVRDFSARVPPREIVEEAIRAAATAPSGANMQPWHFTVVTDPQVKAQIRAAAEEEERAFYEGRAGEEWLAALAPLGTDENKPFLETAPYLIVIFQQNYGLDAGGRRVKHYYVQESVGIATGMLISALHLSGLATLTHTPSPMGFLREVLGRPKNERAVMILVAGYPAGHASVPDITKKPFAEICNFL